MTGKIRICELGGRDAVAYDEFLESQDQALVYHTRPWHRLLRDAFRFEITVIVGWCGNEIVGALPLAEIHTLLGGRRAVSLPFSHRVPVLGENRGVVNALVCAGVEKARAWRCRYLELRSGDVHLPGEAWSRTQSYVSSAVALRGDDEQLFRALRSNTRNQLRQALGRDDLRLDLRNDDQGFRAFERLVAETRRRKGTLTYPRQFFRSLQQMGRGGLVQLDLAFSGEKCIAGMATFSYGRCAIYGYSASVEDVEELRKRPINALMWRAMRRARDQGAEVLDLGTSLPTQDGLIHFKEGWGAVSEPLPYIAWSASGGGRAVSQDGTIARLGSEVLQRMPLRLFMRVAPFLMRQVA